MSKADIERAIEDFSHAVNHAKCIESSYIESPITTEGAETALAVLRNERKRMEGCEWCLERERKKTYTMFWERDKRGNPKSARQRMKGKERYCSVCGRSKLPSTCKARNSNENGAGNASGANDQQVKSDFEKECEEFVERITELAVRTAYDTQTGKHSQKRKCKMKGKDAVDRAVEAMRASIVHLGYIDSKPGSYMELMAEKDKAIESLNASLAMFEEALASPNPGPFIRPENLEENEFMIVERSCAEVYTKDKYLPTPIPKDCVAVPMRPKTDKADLSDLERAIEYYETKGKCTRIDDVVRIALRKMQEAEGKKEESP